jgi:hypothetical protein
VIDAPPHDADHDPFVVDKNDPKSEPPEIDGAAVFTTAPGVQGGGGVAGFPRPGVSSVTVVVVAVVVVAVVVVAVVVAVELTVVVGPDVTDLVVVALEVRTPSGEPNPIAAASGAANSATPARPISRLRPNVPRARMRPPQFVGNRRHHRGRVR